MRNFAWLLAGSIILSAAPVLAVGAGPTAYEPGRVPWAQWQGRLSLGTTSSPWTLGVERQTPALSSATLMGDYYFSDPQAAPGKLGGFRATSGLIFGPRGMLGSYPPAVSSGGAFSIGSHLLGSSPLPRLGEAAGERVTLPYVGLGYTGLSVRSRWSFSADLGLVGQSPAGAAGLGRAFGSGRSLDEAIREMRLAPLLQVGVSYAF